MADSRRIVVLFAHPNPVNSRAQIALREAIKDLEGVEIRDLYHLYPDFFIKVKSEQEALLRADLIIFQHPIYWYSCPAILKEWQDLVLEKGWAYGPGGVALRGKDFMQVVSAGGLETAYQRQGSNRFLLPELLRPFEATAYLCGLNYYQPFTMQGIGTLTSSQIAEQAQAYRQLLMQYLEQGNACLTALNTAKEGYSHV